MSAPAITISQNRPVAAAARLMVEERVNRLPVVSEEGRLIGIVTRADLVRAFTRPDEEIRAEILQNVLTHVLWIDPDAIEVTVRDGEGDLNGQLETSAEVILLHRLVEQVPGVVSVTANVTCRIDNEGRAGRFAANR